MVSFRNSVNLSIENLWGAMVQVINAKGGWLENPSLVPRLRVPAGKKTIWWTKSNFLGLLSKSGNDQWDCEISNYYVALPSNSTSPFKYSYLFCRGWLQNVLIVARLHCRKGYASPRNLTWFTVSPHQRVGSGDETRKILQSAPHICYWKTSVGVVKRVVRVHAQFQHVL